MGTQLSGEPTDIQATGLGLLHPLPQGLLARGVGFLGVGAAGLRALLGRFDLAPLAPSVSRAASGASW